MQYRKKPITISAIEWKGDNLNDVMSFMNWRHANHDNRHGLVINTLEGQHSASIGDFIIKGIAGEFYPCKPEIFWQTYEQV